MKTGWLPIRSRIDNAMITMLFKIKNRIAPNYLFELLPKINADCISYALRSCDDIRLPVTRGEAFRRSFCPTAIRLWNKLNQSVRNSPTLTTLKLALKKDSPEKPILFYYGERWPAVHHARLRMQCSKLNFDLCYRLYVRDNPACRCGASRESASHFLVSCPLYYDIRLALINTVNEHTVFNVETLLYGDKSLTDAANRSIFGAVHDFISQSN